MNLNKHKNFAESLRNMQKARGLSLVDFAKELDIPKSTLRSIMESGHTSLYTAMRIAEKLAVPLDTLVNGALSTHQLRILDGLMVQLDWFDRLPKAQQEEARRHICALIGYIQESSADRE